MAHVHIIDSGAAINCPYGRVTTAPSQTSRWTPKLYTCGAQSGVLPDYDDRFLGGGDSDVDLVVDGC